MGQINPLFWHLASTQTRLIIYPVWRSPAGHLAQERLIFLISAGIMIKAKSKYYKDNQKAHDFILTLSYQLILIMTTTYQISIDKYKYMIEQIPDPNQAEQQSLGDKIKGKKNIIITVFIVILAVICFSFSIFAMSAAVGFFSYMFSLVGELTAKAYLQEHYSWYMAITYLAIFGLVIVLADTAVHFTQFTQKQRILWIHVTFYIVMFICGIVALVGQSEYQAYMTSKINKTCGANDFECSLAIKFVIYRGQVVSYFIGYCICFFAYGALYHYSSYCQRIARQEENINKLKIMKQQPLGQTKQKNLSFVSNDQNSF